MLAPLLMLLATAVALGSDLAREQRIREQLEDAIPIGESLTLKADDTPFFAILTESISGGATHGAAILLHGLGANPDWVDVIQPLRTQLPEYGWETLSIQGPVAANDAPRAAYRALIPEAGPRIDAAVKFLKEQRHIDNIVLIGHSLGARMGAEYLASRPPPEIRAFVAIGLPATDKDGSIGTLDALAKIRLPMLDLYGSRDLDRVRGSRRQRAAAASRSGNDHYRQMEIEGADHLFTGLDQTLVASIRAWLAKNASMEGQGKPR